MGLFSVLLAGVIVGLLGKLVAPDRRDNTPLWLTILCGIAGVVVGWYVYHAFGGHHTKGIDWVRWIVAVLVSAGFVMLASTLTGRNTGPLSLGRRRRLFRL